MSHVRAEVLRVSRSRTGWREGGNSPTNPGGQIQYINSLKSTFEGSSSSSANGNGGDKHPQPQQPQTHPTSPWQEATPKSPVDASNFRPQRHIGGTKVSTIANMFQSMAPPPPPPPMVHGASTASRPGFNAKLDSPQNGANVIEREGRSPDVHKVLQQERRPSLEASPQPPPPPSGISVHLNRTESQVARFNSARAMFERLEEKIIQTTVKSSGTAGGSVSPRRSAFSPTLYSRSPSPVCSQTQSVGCSPKRGSPLSPREKSRSEDNIVSEPNSHRDATAVFCSSSHVNGRGHNLDFDLTCSGAGEAIVSPGPLSPHLARYLAEDLLSMTPKCVGVEEKTAAAAAAAALSSKFVPGASQKPSPLCPKPAADLIFAKTAITTKRAGPKRDDGFGLRSRRAQQSQHAVHNLEATCTTPETAHIPGGEVVGDERPILIGVVEKKASVPSNVLPSDNGMCNGRLVCDTTFSFDSPQGTLSETLQRPSAQSASKGGLPSQSPSPLPSGICQNLVEIRKPSFDDVVVVEATNQQLLRDVQGSFNRSSSLDSGSQILVLSSGGTSDDDATNSSLLVALNPGEKSDHPEDSARETQSSTSLASHSVIEVTKAAFIPLPSPVTTQDQFIRRNEDNDSSVCVLEANSLSSLSPAETSTASVSSPQLDSDDGCGFSTQGTSPLSPKADCGGISLKVSVPQSSVIGDSTARSKGSVHHQSFLAGADVTTDVTTDFPEMMTPEEASRLLSSSSDDNVNDDEPVVSKTSTRNSWFDDKEETPFFGKDVQQEEEETSVIVEVDDAERLLATTDDCRRLEHEEDGVHIFEDGQFWLEIPGLMESDNEEVIQAYGAIVTPKRRDRVKFSTKPIRVYSTFSVTDYDRRNDDVDPVSASAEYELEKRVEKMDVFPVELIKGPEGLGLSIIGMGVGADAGLEKLGIFVKTITDGGAAYKDGRIDVNDQIIEVDGKSLVGVTQAYAASVLRNTSGLVRFSIGREKDGENSEVAQLISQSLQADREREYRRKNYEDELIQQRQNSDVGARNDNGYPGLTLPIPSLSVQPSSSSSSLDPQIMVQEDSTPEEGEDEPTCEVFDLEASSESPSPDSSDSRMKLKEVTILERLQCEREEYENRIRMLTARLAEVEHIIEDAKDEVAKYQNMLEESQGQYIVLERKYYKAKKLIKECQQREQDLLHREDYHIQQLQEKDQEYNALVKSLKDRVIQLEQELMETQRAAGLPVKLPYDNSSIKQLQLTPQLLRRPHVASQRKRTSSLLDTDISDSELADSSSNQFDISPDSDDMETKTSTVERKPIAKDGDLFEKAVPQHELLDSTAAKTKAELASKLGSLANRQPPSLKKTSSSGSSGDGLPFDSRESDSNDTSLGSSREDLDCAETEPVRATSPVLLAATLCSSTSDTTTLLPNASEEFTLSHLEGEDSVKTSLDANVAFPSGRGSPVRIDGKFAEEIRIILERKSIEAKRQVVSEEPSSCAQDKPAHSAGHGHLLTDVPRNMTPSPMSTVSSHSSSSNTTGGSDGAVAVTGSTARPTVTHSSKRDSPSGCVRLCPQSLPPFTCCCLPGTALHIAEFTVTERTDYPDEIERGVSHDVIRSPAPSIIGDHGGVSTGNPSSDRRPHQWHSCSVSDWSSGQVGQWLLALSMEQYISVFMDNNVGGQELLNMDGTKLKNMGVVNSNDRSVLKRRVKDLKALVEKERKAIEKELKTKEKNQKKAERAAEKAVKRK